MILDALLKQHAEPAFCSCKEMHASLADILDVGARTQQQVIEYRRLLTGAALIDGTDEDRGTVEHVHQTLRRAEKDAVAFIEFGQRLAKSIGQLDRYLREHASRESTADSLDSVAETASPVAAP